MLDPAGREASFRNSGYSIMNINVDNYAAYATARSTLTTERSGSGRYVAANLTDGSGAYGQATCPKDDACGAVVYYISGFGTSGACCPSGTDIVAKVHVYSATTDGLVLSSPTFSKITSSPNCITEGQTLRCTPGLYTIEVVESESCVDTDCPFPIEEMAYGDCGIPARCEAGTDARQLAQDLAALATNTPTVSPVAIPTSLPGPTSSAVRFANVGLVSTTANLVLLLVAWMRRA